MRKQKPTQEIVLVAILIVGLAFLLWNPRAPVKARESQATTQETPFSESALFEAPNGDELDEVQQPDTMVDKTQAPSVSAAASLARLEEFSSMHSSPSALPPLIVLENLRALFRQYHSRFGGNPVGTNFEITQALNGGNPGRTQFLSVDDGMQFNERGELTDQWGTPFFFHQLSRTEMEIHSAGPDRRMGTSDDLVLR
jgi:hypothetical protein